MANLKNGNTSNSRGKKRFYWDLVLNNYTDEDCVCVKQIFEEISDAYIIGKEIGSEMGTPHLQMMIKLKKGNYKSYLLNKFKNNCVGNRISIREGRNIEALKNYVMKDGEIYAMKNIEAIEKPMTKEEKEINAERRLRHIMTHNIRWNKEMYEYIEEHMDSDDEILNVYKEMYKCDHCVKWC